MTACLVSALHLLPPTGLGQSTAQDWQAQAVQKYPELGVRGSPLNQQFVAAAADRRRTAPAFFSDPRWPLLLADELARKPAVSTPPPVVATVAPTPTPPASTPAPVPSKADYDAGTLPKVAGLASARFRWWSPSALPVRGVLVLLAGRGGDSRGMVDEREW